MENLEAHFIKDIERIQSLDIVPSILELVCRSTGMGFSAIARVTENKWITCAVKDDISFGIKPGGELKIETTICNEIRSHGQPVVIDEVKNDPHFCKHHTPEMYGFQSYISIPIFRKNGEFFGTLCAIDPRPFPLKASNSVKMFQLYADLISFHMLAQEQLEVKNELLKTMEEKLEISQEDIRQYTHISQHNLKEPLRKLQIFSDMMILDNILPENHTGRQLALKINTLARGFSDMIAELDTFTSISDSLHSFEPVETDDVLNDVVLRLNAKIKETDAVIERKPLPVVRSIPSQMRRVFINILDNALTFANTGDAPLVNIYSEDIDAKEFLTAGLNANNNYTKICFKDNGIGIEEPHLQEIFRLFGRLNAGNKFPGIGMGLSQCQKIMRNHGGAIKVQSVPGRGSVFSLYFPDNG